MSKISVKSQATDKITRLTRFDRHGIMTSIYKKEFM